MNIPSQRTSVASNGETKEASVASYASRLDKVIKKPRGMALISSYLKPNQGETLADDVIDEYLETAFTLNAVRVLDRIQRPLGLNVKYSKLISCLKKEEVDFAYTKIIQDNDLAKDYSSLKSDIAKVRASALSDDEKKQSILELNNAFKEKCRPIIEKSFDQNTDQDEVVDLVRTKEWIVDLRRRAMEIAASTVSNEEKKQQLVDLDNVMRSLLTPIANKVERLFPHQDSTNLAKVLENEDAVCAGKVNVLLAISKYLGINARANEVIETLNNDKGRHVYLECDCPSGAKLAIDANYSNVTGLEKMSDGELIALIRKNKPGLSERELNSTLRECRLTMKNAHFIPADSRVVMYFTENTGVIATSDEQSQEARNNPYFFIRVDPYTGHKEIWRANIPHPHIITFPDKDGYFSINSSFTNNTAHYTTNDYSEMGIYLFKKHIEMNPYDTLAYLGLAKLLSVEDCNLFLEKIKKAKPALYWEELSIELAVMYANRGNFDKAVQIFEETKDNNSSAYYRNVHVLSHLFQSKGFKETKEEAIRLKLEAKAMMESARRDNPAVFYMDKVNAIEMSRLYGEQTDEKIKVFEEYRRVRESDFWDASSYTPPFQRLYKFYIEKSKIDPSVLDRAAAFSGEIRVRNPEFYNKNVHSYASDLYVQMSHPEPQSAIVLMEEVRTSSPSVFFQEEENVTFLAKLYADENDTDKATALYEESKSINPASFWNSGDGPYYEGMVHLFTKTKQRSKAMQLYEEAKSNSRRFWEVRYGEGYTQLVKMYAEDGRISEGIAVCLEAMTKDSWFFNPNYPYGGYIQLASLYDQNGQINEAISTMLQGYERDSNFWTTDYSNPNVFKLVDYYEKSGQINEAIAILETLRERKDQYWKTNYYRICELFEKSGEPDKAKETRSKLINIYEGLRSSDQKLFYTLTEKLALLYLAEGEVQKAIEALEEGNDNYVNFPSEAIVTLAELYLQNGDREKATSAYESAIKKYRAYNSQENVQYVIERARANGIELSDA